MAMVLMIIYVVVVVKMLKESMKVIKKLRPPIKVHGGKSYLKSWIISHFPADYDKLSYCEFCCGGCSVLLNKEVSNEEIINDIDKGVVSIFKALRDESKEFIGKLKDISYKEETFTNALERSKDKFDDYIELAVNEYVLRRMSRGGMKRAFAWSDRERGGKPGDVNAWETMLKQLPLVADRIKKVTILNANFLSIAKIWDDEKTLIYIDPPYLPETRTEGSTDVYDHEMSVEDHINILNFIKDARSKIAISGYQSPLYNKHLKNWKVAKKNIANHASQQAVKASRTEFLWTNY
jgi:DNA adenine methylase